MMATPTRPQTEEPSRRVRPRRRWRPYVMLLALALGGGGGAFSGVMAATWASLKPGSVALTDIPQMARPLSRKLNVLVMGSDIPYDASGRKLSNGQGVTRTDTIMLLGIDPNRQRINVLSIPRDTRVLLPDQHTYDKANAAYAIGGADLAVKTVSSFTGVPIDGYVVLHVDGLEKLVDLIGGVDLHIEDRMVYRDRSAKLGINFRPGWQHLDGAQAHQYVRFRHDALGDIGRVQRQQQFIRAAVDKLLNPMVLTKLPQLVGTAQEHIETNLPYRDLVQTANFARSLKKDDMRMVMLPGNFSTGRYLASYWLPDAKAGQQVIAELFPDSSLAAQSQAPSDPALRRQSVRVTVLNGSGEAMMATKAARALRLAGWNVWAIAQAPRVKEKTEVVCQTGITDMVPLLQEGLGVPVETVAASVGDITTDFTVVVGQDYARAVREAKAQAPAVGGSAQ